MERYLLLGSSVMVGGRYVGTLRYLIKPGMAIVEVWVNEVASKDFLMWRTQISAVSREDQTEGGEYVEGLSPRGRGNRCCSKNAICSNIQDSVPIIRITSSWSGFLW